MNNQLLVRINAFGTIDERWDTQPQTTLELQNVRWDRRGGWERCGGLGQAIRNGQAGNPFVGQGKINSMTWFSQHNGGLQYLVWEMNQTLAYFDGSANLWKVLATDRYTTDQPWQRTQYAATGNSLWIVNGENMPLRFDGRRVQQAGFDAPAPSVTVTGYSQGFSWGTSFAGLGLGSVMSKDIMGVGEYAYVMTEVNEFGTESPPSAAFAAVRWSQEAAAAKVDVQPKYFVNVRIPHASGDHVCERRLYRTMNCSALGLQTGAKFYLCATFQGSGSFPYVDGLPDQYLGAELVSSNYGVFPRGAKYIRFFKNTAWVAGMPDYPDRLWYSRPGDFENFPATNFFTIGDADSGEITGMMEFRNSLVVFKRRGTYLVMTDPGSDNFRVKTISRTSGCAAANTIRDVPGVGLMYASENGVDLLTGTIQEGDDPIELNSVSAQLADYWKWRVNASALANAWAEVDKTEREYVLSIPTDGDTENNVCLVFHYEVGAWSLRLGMSAGCMVESHDYRSAFFIGSNSASTMPGVYVYSPGYTTFGATAVTMKLTSGHLDLGGVYEHVNPRSLVVRAVEYGSRTLSVSLYKDRRPTELTTGGQTRKMMDSEYLNTDQQQPRWNEAAWSAVAKWGRARPTTIPFDIIDGNGAKEYQFTIQTSYRAQIIGVSLTGDAQGTKKIPPANAILGTGREE